MLFRSQRDSALSEATKRSLFRSGLSISRAFLRLYPYKLTAAVLFLLVSGLFEGVGIAALLPLLDLLTGSIEQAGQVTKFFAQGLETVGLPLTTGTLVLVVIGAISLKAAFVLSSNVFVGHTVAEIASDFRMRLIRGILSVRWSFFTAEPTGKLTNSLVTETLQSSIAARGLIEIASVGIQTMIYLSLALVLSWQLTLAGIVAGLLIAALLHVFITMSRREGGNQAELMRTYTTSIVEWLHGMKPLKAMGMEQRVSPFLQRETYNLLNVQRRLVIANSALANLQEPIAAVFIGVGLIAAIEFLDVATNTLLVMAVIAVRAVGRIGAVQKAIRKFATSEAFYYAYRSNLDTIERQAEALDRPRDGTELRPAEFASSIVFDHVNYAYEGRKVLDDFCLKLEAGKLTAIVGASGTGKSTMLDMLALLIKPDSGRILVDGVDLQHFAARDWRRLIGYVPQETLLFHGTIRENLTLGDPTVQQADIEHAVRAAGAWDFIAALPEGLDAMAGERGLKLSGGERQRLAIARALIHRPRLLLLDEATSALDAETEQAVCASLAELAAETTVVAISHRPAIESYAHRVYRVRGGKAQEQAGASAADLEPARSRAKA